MKLTKWYYLDNISSSPDKNDNLLEILRDAINIRMRGDVKIGTLLSRTDGSFITSNMHKIAEIQKQDYLIFHGSSIDKESDESYYAKL